MTCKFVGLSVVLACVSLIECSRPRTEAQYLARGKAFLKQGDAARSILEFKNAVHLQPNDAEAEYELASAYLVAGQISEALPPLVKATQLNPKDARAQLKLSELMIRSGDAAVIREGQKRAEQALAASPEDVDTLNALALSELELGNPGDAERHLGDALRNFPQNLHSSVELATVYLTQGKLNPAEDVLKTAASASPESADAAIALGELYRLTKRWSDAGMQFRHALQLQPKEPRALLGLAAAQLQLGQLDEAEKTYRTISSLPGNEYSYLHAAYLFAAGKREAAVREFEMLAKNNPSDRQSRTRLVSAYLLTGRRSDAEKVLRDALKANEHDGDALLQVSQILITSGRPREAEADLNQVLHYRPDSAEAHYLLSRVYFYGGDAARRQSELRDALRYKPSMLAARTELAQVLTLSNSPKAAIELVDAAPGFQNQSVLLIVQRNLALLASGDKQGFRVGVSSGLKIARVPDLLLQDATVKLMDRDSSGARRSFEEVLVQHPSDLRAVRGILLSYTAANQHAAAEQFLLQYAAAHPKSANIQQFAGEWLWSAGANAEARAAFSAAQAADPQYAPADLYMARIEAADGKLEAAQARLNRVISSRGDNVEAHILMALVESKAGNYAPAMNEYRKVLALNPHNRIALNNLAYLLADFANRPDEALGYAQKAVEAAPTSADATGTLGWVFYRKGLYPMAEQYLRQAVSDDGGSAVPNAAIRKYHLAMAYFREGNHDSAVTSLKSALRMNPTLPEAETARRMIESGTAN